MAAKVSNTIKFIDWLEAKAARRGIRTDAALARELGISQTTIGRWREGGGLVTVESVRRTAEAFEIPILYVFVKAGYLTPDEAEVQIMDELDLSTVPLRDILAEIARRSDEAV